MQARYWEKPGKQSAVVRDALPHAIISASDPNSAMSGAVEMSISTFARFMFVLSEEDFSRGALITYGLYLTREKQQRRESRDIFWDTVVSPIFNNRAVRFTFDLYENVYSCDSGSGGDVNADLAAVRSRV